MLVAGHGVGLAEEVAARRDARHRLEGELVLVDPDRLQELHHVLDHLHIEHDLLEGGGEPALEPARRVVVQVCAAEHAAPERHLGLVDRLAVGRGRRVRGRRAIGQPVAPRKLAARDVRLGVLRRPEGGRPRTHVDVRGVGAVEHRRPGARELGERDAEERFRVLLGEPGGERDRGHRAHQRERRDRHHLAVLRHRDQAFRHRLVEAPGAVDGDDGGDPRVGAHLVERHPARDRHQPDAVGGSTRPDRGAVKAQVGAAQVGVVGVEVPGVGGQLHRRHHLVADDVDGVEVVREADEVLVVTQVPVASPAHPVVHAGRPCDEAESHVVAAEDQPLVGVSSGDRERRGGGREQLAHETAVHAHRARRFVHLRAGRLEHAPRAGTHQLDAELFQDPHRGRVDGLDLVLAQDLQRRVGVPRLAPRKLGNAIARALADLLRRPAAAPASSRPVLRHPALSDTPGTAHPRPAKPVDSCPGGNDEKGRPLRSASFLRRWEPAGGNGGFGGPANRHSGAVSPSLDPCDQGWSAACRVQPPTRSRSALMWSGPMPQQPPTIRAPDATQALASSA